MSNSEDAAEDTGKKPKYWLEVEFELGDLEFEAKGKSSSVEKMFRLLMEKLETGNIPVTKPEEEESEEEIVEEEDEESEEDIELPETELEEPETTPTPSHETSTQLVQEEPTRGPEIEVTREKPPTWDSLDSSSPPESTVERKVKEEDKEEEKKSEYQHSGNP